ncbi:MAG: SDR family oxidoreductase [Candidatus Omnitrophota bacterium]|jgi:dTDP-4-dehydrorhamnose reductase
MKTLIIGASGLVGGYLYREFTPLGDIKGTAFPKGCKDHLILDIRDKGALTRLFSEYRPGLVLCPAAITNVEYCQAHPAETREVNVEGVRNVIREVKSNGAKFVFFSSEYIFDGQGGPYAEEDTPQPLNEYGRQKLEVENIIQKELSDYIICRTTVVYGWEAEGKNFVLQMLKNLEGRIPMKVPSDQLSSPTYAQDLARSVRALVEQGLRGIFNLVGSEVMDRYTFAGVICSVFDLNAKLISPVATSELGQKALRPLKAGLKIDKAIKIPGVVLSSAQEGLRKMKEGKDAYFNFK